MRPFTYALAAAALAAMTSGALGVSIGEMANACGEDSKAYCKGVGYGDPMLACLNESYKKLAPSCKAVVDRLNDGEGVSLF